MTFTHRSPSAQHWHKSCHIYFLPRTDRGPSLTDSAWGWGESHFLFEFFPDKRKTRKTLAEPMSEQRKGFLASHWCTWSQFRSRNVVFLGAMRMDTSEIGCAPRCVVLVVFSALWALPAFQKIQAHVAVVALGRFAQVFQMFPCTAELRICGYPSPWRWHRRSYL